MKKFIQLSLLLFGALLLTGCAIFPPSGDDVAVTSGVSSNMEEISGTIEFPEDTVSPDRTLEGIRRSFQPDESQLKCIINDQEVTLVRTSSSSRTFRFSGAVIIASQYEIKVTNIRNVVMMKAYTSSDKKSDVTVNPRSTAKAILYDEKVRQSSSERFSFVDFEKNVKEFHFQKIEEIIRKRVISQEFTDGLIHISEITEVTLRVAEVIVQIPLPGEEPKNPSDNKKSNDGSDEDQNNKESDKSTVTPPSAVLALNNGDTATNNLEVTLNISSLENAEGALEMSVNGGDFSKFEWAKKHTLTAPDGSKSVTVVIRDGRGELSKEITDTIIVDRVKPTVVAVTPADQTANVAINTAVTVEFSEEIDLKTLTPQTFVSVNSVTGSLSYASKKLTFTPQNPLNKGTLYSFVIKSTVADPAGNIVGTDYSFSFTTPANAPTLNWDSPAQITNSTGNLDAPKGKIQISSSGKTFVSWKQNLGGVGTILGAYNNGTSFATPVALGADALHYYNPTTASVEVSGSHYAITTWQSDGYSSIWHRRVVNGVPMGTGPTKILGGELADRAFYPQIQMDSTGKSVLLYVDYTSSGNGTRHDLYSTVHAASNWPGVPNVNIRAAAGGSGGVNENDGNAWTTPVRISDGIGRVDNHQFVMDQASANGIVVWIQTQYDSSITVPTGIFVSLYDGSTWSAPVNLENSQNYANIYSLKSVFNNGRAIVSWQYEGNLYLRSYDGNSWSPVETVTTFAQDRNLGEYDITIDENGKGVIAWVDNPAGGGQRAKLISTGVLAVIEPSFHYIYSKYFDGATWGLPVKISESEPTLYNPSLVMRSNTALILWVEDNSPNTRGALAYSLFKNGSFSSVARISEGSIGFYNPTGGISAGGRCLFVSKQYDNSNSENHISVTGVANIFQ